MSDPSKQKDSKEGHKKVFTLSSALLHKKSSSLTQFKGVFGATEQAAESEESKGKTVLPFEPNLEGAHKREQRDYDASQANEAADMESEDTQKKAKSLFYSSGATGQAQSTATTYRGGAPKFISASTKTALGGSVALKMDSDLQQNKIMREEKLFDQDTKKLYSKDMLFPLEYPPRLFGQMEQEEVQADPIDFLRNDFAMIQFPQNLPLEGFYKLDPPHEHVEKDLTSDTNIFSSLINQRFDSTGYYLDRDFSKMNLGTAVPVGEKEGIYLGKLIRYKSGKIKMRIGENTFDINPGIKGDFYQEILSVDKDRREASSLTKIQEKFVVKPDLEDFDKP
eukprot:CAMPEP_0176427540 /NCGR_PEP_ID=MMETSP0127-20121128/12628_1 /TAXON_ID=938130 /ORGANISM="Platyophrya macrostoma, Strain WH" /LENGTH=336 /DNA_ID=CAMNT_0017809077 /DNA_START=43 /DNA_END=1049 /DNA_ORIENTATION=-